MRRPLPVALHRRAAYVAEVFNCGWERLGPLRGFLTSGIGFTGFAYVTFVGKSPGWGLAILAAAFVVVLVEGGYALRVHDADQHAHELRGEVTRHERTADVLGATRGELKERSQRQRAECRHAAHALRREVGEALAMLRQAVEDDAYWDPDIDSLPEQAFSDHEHLLTADPGHSSLYAAVRGAYSHLHRVNVLVRSRKKRGDSYRWQTDRPWVDTAEDRLGDVSERLAEADALLEDWIASLDDPERDERLRRLFEGE